MICDQCGLEIQIEKGGFLVMFRTERARDIHLHSNCYDLGVRRHGGTHEFEDHIRARVEASETAKRVEACDWHPLPKQPDTLQRGVLIGSLKSAGGDLDEAYILRLHRHLRCFDMMVLPANCGKVFAVQRKKA